MYPTEAPITTMSIMNQGSRPTQGSLESTTSSGFPQFGSVPNTHGMFQARIPPVTNTAMYPEGVGPSFQTGYHAQMQRQAAAHQPYNLQPNTSSMPAGFQAGQNAAFGQNNFPRVPLPQQTSHQYQRQPPSYFSVVPQSHTVQPNMQGQAAGESAVRRPHTIQTNMAQYQPQTLHQGFIQQELRPQMYQAGGPSVYEQSVQKMTNPNFVSNSANPNLATNSANPNFTTNNVNSNFTTNSANPNFASNSGNSQLRQQYPALHQAINSSPLPGGPQTGWTLGGNTARRSPQSGAVAPDTAIYPPQSRPQTGMIGQSQNQQAPAASFCPPMLQPGVIAPKLPPRLCHVIKGPGYADFYGLRFLVFQDGPYVSCIEENSAAATAGLRVGDKIIEINGFNVEREESNQVLYKMKGLEHEMKLFVMDRATYEEYKRIGVQITSSMSGVVHLRSRPVQPGTQQLYPKQEQRQPTIGNMIQQQIPVQRPIPTPQVREQHHLSPRVSPQLQMPQTAQNSIQIHTTQAITSTQSAPIPAAQSQLNSPVRMEPVVSEISEPDDKKVLSRWYLLPPTPARNDTETSSSQATVTVSAMQVISTTSVPSTNVSATQETTSHPSTNVSAMQEKIFDMIRKGTPYSNFNDKRASESSHDDTESTVAPNTQAEDDVDSKEGITLVHSDKEEISPDVIGSIDLGHQLDIDKSAAMGHLNLLTMHMKSVIDQEYSVDAYQDNEAENTNAKNNSSDYTDKGIPNTNTNNNSSDNTDRGIPNTNAKNNSSDNIDKRVPNTNAKNNSSDNTDRGIPNTNAKNNSSDNTDRGIPNTNAKNNSSDNIDKRVPNTNTKNNSSDNIDKRVPNTNAKNNSSDNTDRGIPNTNARNNSSDNIDIGIPNTNTKNNSSDNTDKGIPNTSAKNNSSDNIDKRVTAGLENESSPSEDTSQVTENSDSDKLLQYKIGNTQNFEASTSSLITAPKVTGSTEKQKKGASNKLKVKFNPPKKASGSASPLKKLAMTWKKKMAARSIAEKEATPEPNQNKNIKEHEENDAIEQRLQEKEKLHKQLQDIEREKQELEQKKLEQQKDELSQESSGNVADKKKKRTSSDAELSEACDERLSSKRGRGGSARGRGTGKRSPGSASGGASHGRQEGRRRGRGRGMKVVAPAQNLSWLELERRQANDGMAATSPVVGLEVDELALPVYEKTAEEESSVVEEPISGTNEQVDKGGKDAQVKDSKGGKDAQVKDSKGGKDAQLKDSKGGKDAQLKDSKGGKDAQLKDGKGGKDAQLKDGDPEKPIVIRRTDITDNYNSTELHTNANLISKTDRYTFSWVEFHGCKVLLINSEDGDYLAMKELVFEVFGPRRPEKSLQASRSTPFKYLSKTHKIQHIYKTKEKRLNIMYKEIDPEILELVYQILFDKKVLHKKQNRLGMISLVDALRLYHFITKVGTSECSDINVQCVVAHNSDTYKQNKREMDLVYPINFNVGAKSIKTETVVNKEKVEGAKKDSEVISKNISSTKPQTAKPSIIEVIEIVDSDEESCASDTSTTTCPYIDGVASKLNQDSLVPPKEDNVPENEPIKTENDLDLQEHLPTKTEIDPKSLQTFWLMDSMTKHYEWDVDEPTEILHANAVSEEIAQDSHTYAVSEEITQDSHTNEVSEEIVKDSNALTMSEEIAKDSHTNAVSEEVAKDSHTNAVSEEVAKDSHTNAVSEEIAEDSHTNAVSEEIVKYSNALTMNGEIAKDSNVITMSEEIAKDSHANAVSEEIANGSNLVTESTNSNASLAKESGNSVEITEVNTSESDKVTEKENEELKTMELERINSKVETVLDIDSIDQVDEHENTGKVSDMPGSSDKFKSVEEFFDDDELDFDDITLIDIGTGMKLVDEGDRRIEQLGQLRKDAKTEDEIDHAWDEAIKMQKSLQLLQKAILETDEKEKEQKEAIERLKRENEELRIYVEQHKAFLDPMPECDQASFGTRDPTNVDEEDKS